MLDGRPPFPRINGFVLVPNETGATVGMISSVQSDPTPLGTTGFASSEIWLIFQPNHEP